MCEFGEFPAHITAGAEFLRDLSTQGFRGRLTGLDLAPGELPLQRQVGAVVSLAEEVPPLLLNHSSNNRDGPIQYRAA